MVRFEKHTVAPIFGTRVMSDFVYHHKILNILQNNYLLRQATRLLSPPLGFKIADEYVLP